MTTPQYPGQDPQHPDPQYPNPQYQNPQYQNPQGQNPQYPPQQNPYSPGAQQPYPGAQHPYPGGGYPGQGQPAAPAPDAPGTVKGAFVIYLIAALLALVGIVLSLTSNVWDQAVAAAGNTSGVSTQTLVNAVKITTVVVGVILLGLYLLFAFKMRAGRNWARIVLTVLSALSILSPASASSSVKVNNTVYESTSSQTTGWIGAALAVVAIVLMYLPASNAYFAASKAARQRQLQ